MSGSTLVESSCMMMNISLSAAAGGQLGTPPLRRRRHCHSPAGTFVTAASHLHARDARSPSPASYPESILRAKHNRLSSTTSSTASSSSSSSSESNTASLPSHQPHHHHHHLHIHKHHHHVGKISGAPSPSALSSQLSQISLSTGTTSLDSNPRAPKPVCADDLAKRLQEPLSDTVVPNFFLLDCRSFISFNLNKIRGALNVCCTDRCSRRRLTSGKSSILDMVKGTDNEKDTFKNHLQSADVILYDDNTKALDELKDTNNTLQLVGKVLELQGANVMYLQGGLETFQKQYDDLCVQCAKPSRTPLYSPTSATIQEPAIDTATASRILPFLFLGNERDAANESRLRELNITHVLNVTAHIPFFPEQQRLGLTCKRLPASDSGQQNLRQYFHTASDFIDEVRSSGGRVLVHCQAGVSRSATVTLAYIMLHSRLTLHEAFALVKSRRAIVSPNFNFMGQLYSLEQALEAGEEERRLLANAAPLDLGLPTSAVFSPTPAVPETPLPASKSMSNGFKFQ